MTFFFSSAVFSLVFRFSFISFHVAVFLGDEYSQVVCIDMEVTCFRAQDFSDPLHAKEKDAYTRSDVLG